MNIIYYEGDSEEFLENLDVSDIKNTAYLPISYNVSDALTDIFSKVFRNISTGFMSASEYIIVGERNYCICITEDDIDHFKEDLLLTLLKPDINGLIHYNTDEMDTMANFCANVSYTQLIREHRTYLGNTTARIMKIQDITIGRGEISDDVTHFEHWFDQISTEDFMELWSIDSYRLLIKWIRRFPGKKHEWIMCSMTDKAKQLGIPGALLDDLVTPTCDCSFLNSENSISYHGFKGSTTMHNQLAEVISSATDAQHFYTLLYTFISTYQIEGNKDDLLEILSDYIS